MLRVCLDVNQHDFVLDFENGDDYEVRIQPTDLFNVINAMRKTGISHIYLEITEGGLYDAYEKVCQQSTGDEVI